MLQRGYIILIAGGVLVIAGIVLSIFWARNLDSLTFKT
jgi:hypothetical protein